MVLKRSSKPRINRKVLISMYIIGALLVVMLAFSLRFYNRIFGPNVVTEDSKGIELYLPSDPTFEEVVGLLELSGAVQDMKSFIWVARQKAYPINPKGGRYILKNGMSNNDLVNMLRSGAQTPVNVTFNNIRRLEDLAAVLADRLEADSAAFMKAFTDEQLIEEVGFQPNTLMALFIPNTYQMYWNTSPKAFVQRMKKEYDAFWNEDRLKKAETIRLTPVQVSTLASIVDEETIKRDEKPRVAGLYINRLDIGMRLQADPTIKFVIGNFAVNRILTKDLEIDSPYNTYIYAGLPPGPIRMPSVDGIDAVLNYEKHDFLYMCAKDDFSGYHAFARTLRQHNINAEKYRKALNRSRIYR